MAEINASAIEIDRKILFIHLYNSFTNVYKLIRQIEGNSGIDKITFGLTDYTDIH